MLFRTRHETTYRYSAPIRLGEHLLRMTPLNSSVRVNEHTIEVTPAPAWREDGRDAFGNAATRLGFDGETDTFTIVSTIEAEVPEPSPLPRHLPPLPWPAPATHAPDPAFLGRGEDASVAAFAREIAAEARGAVPAFLDQLTNTLFERTDRAIRPSGDAQSATHTLESASGACRDLSVLFMAACRSMGLPSRFVSGYQAEADTPDGRRHLHAWPEVWLPGAGWRGFDPMHGRPVLGGHLALAAAPVQSATMPVEGSFYGPGGVTSTLEFNLEIDAR